MDHFELVSEYQPTGDQPTGDRRSGEGLSRKAISVKTLLGVTGSGKDIYDGKCHRSS